MSQTTEVRPENKEAVERGFAVVCDVFDVARMAVLGRTRSGPGWRARQTLCLLLNEHAGIVNAEVGAALAGRTNNAPLAAIRTLKRDIKVDAELAGKVDLATKLFGDWLKRRTDAAAA